MGKQKKNTFVWTYWIEIQMRNMLHHSMYNVSSTYKPLKKKKTLFTHPNMLYNSLIYIKR